MEQPVVMAELSPQKVCPLGTLLFSMTKPSRISRSEYWLRGFLPVGAVWFFVSLLGVVERRMTGVPMSVVEMVGSLFLCWPGSVVILKRMRDRNRSLLWLWLLIVPIVGIFYCVWLMFIDLGCFRGTVGRNQYGEDPLANLPSPESWPVDNVPIRSAAAAVIGVVLSMLTLVELRDAFLNPQMTRMVDEIYKAFL